MRSDVAIIGAGPAGALAAMLLARRGWDVLVVDQHEFPRDKVCGGGIPVGSLQILRESGLEHKVESAGFQPVKGIAIYGSRGRTWTSWWHSKLSSGTGDSDFVIAKRTEFDNLIFESAMESGARFQKGRVSSVINENGCIRGVRLKSGNDKTAEIRSKITIGADGATSIITRNYLPELFTQSKKWVAIRGYLPGNGFESHLAEFHLLPHLLPGYGWVFPVNEKTVNIGLGMINTHYKSKTRPLRDIFNEFCETEVIHSRVGSDATPQHIASWTIPVYSQRKVKRTLPGGLVIGDAACLVDPLTGEGIHNALKSAQIAVDVVHTALEQGQLDRLNEYDTRLRREMSRIALRSDLLSRYIMSSEWLMRGIVNVANNLPSLIDTIFTAGSSDYRVKTQTD